MLNGIAESGKMTKFSELVKEFSRYFLVGGLAFLIDTSVLFLFQTYVFYQLAEIGVLISTALGFLVGLTVNYFLSITYVFKQGEARVKNRQVESFLIFAIIGLVGLGLTELGMFIGMKILGINYYLMIKVLVAALVLIWNYVARKIIIFK